MSASFKEELRKDIRSKFAEWDANSKRVADVSLISKLKDSLTHFSSNWKLQYGELPILGLYLPLKHEPNILEILDWNVGRVSFPYNKNQDFNVMEYCCFLGKKSDLPESVFFLKVEKPQFCVPDLVLVPGLAFDRRGYRLGQGKGYFDCYFAQHECMSIGLCYSWQLLKQVGALGHDKIVKTIITEEEILKIKGNEFL